jgi:hypothetical protein
MSHTTFALKYTGEALENHEMDVAILAPALLAMSKLVEEITKTTSNGVGTSTLSVKGNVKSGSIIVDLTVTTSILTTLRDMLAGQTATSVINAVQLMGLVVATYAFIKKKKGALPIAVIELDNETKKLEFKDGTSEIVSTIQHNLYMNIDIRTSIYNIVKPLESDGIDTLFIGEEIEVHKTEMHLFYTPNITETLNANLHNKILVIESIVFKENNKWRFNDGGTSFQALITDDVFLKSIDTGVRFAKGDWLKVELLESQIVENNKLRKIFTITKVIEHVKKEQVKLDF